MFPGLQHQILKLLYDSDPPKPVLPVFHVSKTSILQLITELKKSSDAYAVRLHCMLFIFADIFSGIDSFKEHYSHNRLKYLNMFRRIWYY